MFMMLLVFGFFLGVDAADEDGDDDDDQDDYEDAY